MCRFRVAVVYRHPSTLTSKTALLLLPLLPFLPHNPDRILAIDGDNICILRRVSGDLHKGNLLNTSPSGVSTWKRPGYEQKKNPLSSRRARTRRSTPWSRARPQVAMGLNTFAGVPETRRKCNSRRAYFVNYATVLNEWRARFFKSVPSRRFTITGNLIARES